VKPKFTLLTGLLIAPPAAVAQAKPEVATATKASKRAGESAPAEKKALWQRHKDALRILDISLEARMNCTLPLTAAFRFA
jgi:hypothetical protein